MQRVNGPRIGAYILYCLTFAHAKRPQRLPYLFNNLVPTFSRSSRYISCIHLVKSLEKIFGKGEICCLID